MIILYDTILNSAKYKYTLVKATQFHSQQQNTFFEDHRAIHTIMF